MTATLQRSSFRSPLRYPGGKQRAAKRIADLFPSVISPLRIASPFFGGGSVELELASRGHTIVGSDFFAPVAAFWQQLKSKVPMSFIRYGVWTLSLKWTKKPSINCSRDIRARA